VFFYEPISIATMNLWLRRTLQLPKFCAARAKCTSFTLYSFYSKMQAGSWETNR